MLQIVTQSEPFVWPTSSEARKKMEKQFENIERAVGQLLQSSHDGERRIAKLEDFEEVAREYRQRLEITVTETNTLVKQLVTVHESQQETIAWAKARMKTERLVYKTTLTTLLPLLGTAFLALTYRTASQYYNAVLGFLGKK